MGFSGLARWQNAPPTGLALVRDNLMRNYGATFRGRWLLHSKSYRSTLNFGPERNMYTLTMDDHVFVDLEDSSASTGSEVLAAAPPGEEAAYLDNPTHFRTTSVAVSPPGALDQLLTQIKAPWVPVRQGSAGNAQRQAPGHQLVIDGHVYSIGTDWIVRFGNVILAGNTLKGMVLELEYLPLPTFPSDGSTPPLLANMIASLLPAVEEAKIVSITMGDAQWEDVLWDREALRTQRETKQSEPEDPDDPYLWDGPEVKSSKPNDWTGLHRDRRSAYMIIGALRSEGLL